jgi:uncharacterized Zn finger protein
MYTNSIEVCIKGSTGTPYVATFTREGNSLKTTCSCPAGEKRTHCKHRLALFAGDVTAVSGDIQSGLITQLSVMVRGTEVEFALQAVAAAETEAKAAVDRVKHAKKYLDRVMHK